MPFNAGYPVELPDGRLVCRPHRLVVCTICDVDYGLMEEDEPVRNIDHVPFIIGSGRPGESLRDPPIGTGRVIPTKFVPPKSDDTPQSLFLPGISVKAIPPVHRFIHQTKKSDFLIFADGACLDNGGSNPQGGCAFVYRPRTSSSQDIGYVRFHLEAKGPTGELHPQTNNRAELRAVIAALAFRAWNGEGCKCLVIATDSEYVVEGVTNWISTWIQNGWKTSSRAAVKNKDLWQCLLGEIEKFDGRGMKVQFWCIPRELNTEADHHARAGARESTQDHFANPMGVLV